MKFTELHNRRRLVHPRLIPWSRIESRGHRPLGTENSLEGGDSHRYYFSGEPPGLRFGAYLRQVTSII